MCVCVYIYVYIIYIHMNIYILCYYIDNIIIISLLLLYSIGCCFIAILSETWRSSILTVRKAHFLKGLAIALINFKLTGNF